MSGSERGSRPSSLYIRIIFVGVGPTVVRSWGGLSNWVRAGIIIPLIIISGNILSASSIPPLDVDS